MITKGKVNVIIDGQWGSTGKGLLAGYLYTNYKGIDLGVCDFMPNAGHTVHMTDGRRFVSRLVPVAAAFERAACIGPHAALDLDVLKHELAALRELGNTGSIIVHPHAVVVTKQDKETEAAVLGRIASTLKGGHYAGVRKLMRAKDALLASMCSLNLNEFGVLVADTQDLVQKTLAGGGTVLAETAQGFDLGLNHGVQWPYVTGRDCLVGRALDNAGASVRDCGSIIGIVRTFPIRVGNTEEGQSGPFYADQEELDWEEVSRRAGRSVIEKTTVTDRVRRVFTFSWTQLRRFLVFCRPDHLCLTHWDYLDGMSNPDRRAFLNRLNTTCAAHGCKLSLISTGPKNEDVWDVQTPKAFEMFLSETRL